MSSREQKEFRAFQQESSGIKDSINPEKSSNLRAANAEEALIAFIFNNPDAAKRILERMPPEKFLTAFNRRVYRVILGKIIDGKAFSLTDISEDFSVEEISAVARILARYHSVTVTIEDADEYIQVILQENDKLNAEKVISADEKDIQEYLQKLKEQKK